MHKIYLFFSIFSLFTFLIPLSSRGQCTGKVSVAYYNNGTPTSQQLSNGQSAGSIPVCPVAGAQYSFSATSDSPGVLTWARVITPGASPATDVVEVLSTATLAANTAFPLNASFTAATTFRIEAAASGSCTDDVFGYITFAPTLTLASNLRSVCSGSAATLTASGASDGVYTWLANGTVLPDESGNSITVNPTATTTYAVKANTS